MSQISGIHSQGLEQVLTGVLGVVSLRAGWESRLVLEVFGQDCWDLQLSEGGRAAGLLQETPHGQPGLGQQGFGMSCGRKITRSPSRHTTLLPSNPALPNGKDMD